MMNDSLMYSILFLLASIQFVTIDSFSLATKSPTKSSSTTSLHCICIDCKYVTSCKAYNFVESKHEQPHMTDDPTFEPRDGSPTIHVNVRTIRTKEDKQKELKRMWKEHENETQAAKESNPDLEEGGLHGAQVYDLSPVTTYEYDVVSCADYVEDKGCWIRNMPQQIKDANPNFVPS
jgi:hypothetical protein